MSDEELENVDPFEIMSDIKRTSDLTHYASVNTRDEVKKTAEIMASLKADLKTDVRDVLSSFKADKEKMVGESIKTAYMVACGAILAFLLLIFVPRLHCLASVGGEWQELSITNSQTNQVEYTRVCNYY